MAGNTIRVWDLPVRLFHWSLVLAFGIAYLTGDELQTLHVWAGYVVLGLIGFRLAWGVIGTRYARFSDFIYRPATVIAYLKDLVRLRGKRYLGHNPAGGAMVLALLGSLLATTMLGLAAYAAKEGAGPLADSLAGVSHFWKEVFEGGHEFFANLTLILVAVHLVGVAVGSVLHRENLPRSMVTGLKRREPD
ncbi:MAG: cytochrome b/b6 domain-containing protein [Gammaproteobacteria bacterium]|jgi:cytochrome b